MKKQFSKTEAIVGMICLSIAMFALDADNFKTATVFGIIGVTAMISVMLDISMNFINKEDKR